MTTLNSTEKLHRINLNRVSPEVYEAMVALNNAAAKDLDPDLAELIKIRASQMNHCAFCVDMHSTDARKRGINEQKLSLLPAWQEAGDLYTEQEQAALALTEAMTDLVHDRVSEEVYGRAAEAFSERELGQVIAMALTINAWNRIGVTTRLKPPRR
jgi:AhpD family alkylhydroperoxidase